MIMARMETTNYKLKTFLTFSLNFESVKTLVSLAVLNYEI
jgi:hypothetical protein